MAAAGTGYVQRNRLLHDALGDRRYDGVDVVQAFVQRIELLGDTLDIMT